jgi:LmbE family N-acetylglucosaminyl deacetylase
MVAMANAHLISSLLFASIAASSLFAQSTKIRIIAFGAHPDDCDIRASGTAALWVKMGYAVKFVSVTNGDAGHQTASWRGVGSLRQRNRRGDKGLNTMF